MLDVVESVDREGFPANFLERGTQSSFDKVERE